MELNFLMDQYSVRDYTHIEEYVPISPQTAYLRMGQDAVEAKDWTPIYVDTVVEKRFAIKWGCGKHWWRIRCKHPDHLFVMTLDCDTEMGMLAAAHVLKTKGIGYAVVKSSASHSGIPRSSTTWAIGPQGVQGVVDYTVKPKDHDSFWLITDVVAPIAHVVNVMRTIPGVDPRYVEHCQYKKTLHLRAHPRVGQIPTFVGEHTLTNKAAIEWYEAFRAHFSSSQFRAAVAAWKLRHALKDGTINQLIADPNFDV